MKTKRATDKALYQRSLAKSTRLISYNPMNDRRRKIKRKRMCYIYILYAYKHNTITHEHTHTYTYTYENNEMCSVFFFSLKIDNLSAFGKDFVLLFK